MNAPHCCFEIHLFERLINEPTAAAIAYGISADKPGRLAVVDIGGGTFDVTILDCQQGLFQVVSSDGDLSLGGAHMDELILTHVIKQVELANDIKITNEDKIALSRLKLAAEKAKAQSPLVLLTQFMDPWNFVKSIAALIAITCPTEQIMMGYWASGKLGRHNGVIQYRCTCDSTKPPIRKINATHASKHFLVVE